MHIRAGALKKCQDFIHESIMPLHPEWSSLTKCLPGCCTICHSTPVIPFRLSFEAGLSLYEQVVYAAKKAVVSGQMIPGEPFPSVRTLSKALKINPNTAHKVIGQLVAEASSRSVQAWEHLSVNALHQRRPSAGISSRRK